MLTEILLALIQAATEFLPISSSGHLALFANLFAKPDLFFFTALHIASLVAVIIFTRREIAFLFTFSKKARTLWKYLIIATIPAAVIGYLLKDLITAAFSSFFVLGIAFLFTSIILFLTKYAKGKASLNNYNALLIGLFQVLALFPGVSRSGMTISAGMFSGIEKEQAARFSFLLFIPLAIGAFLLETGAWTFSTSLLVAFLVCLLASLLFLQLLVKVIKKGSFWWFSFYTLALSIFCFVLQFA